MSENKREMKDYIQDAARRHNAEIILHAGPINPGNERAYREWAKQERKAANIVLLLSTPGGDPHTAYKISRCLQERLKNEHGQRTGHFCVFAIRKCKSAGTLICLGADELIMTNNSELGPLDVQLLKQDEVGERDSGLTPMQAFSALRNESFQIFEKFFLDLRERTSYQVSSRLAAKLASDVCTGLMGNLYSQIDPMRVGETYRNLEIAIDYGERLKTDNVKPGTLAKLVGEYSSHSFVIDRNESCTLFENVVDPDETLTVLSGELAKDIDGQYFRDVPFIACLTDWFCTVFKNEEEGDDEHDDRHPDEGQEGQGS